MNSRDLKIDKSIVLNFIIIFGLSLNVGCSNQEKKFSVEISTVKQIIEKIRLNDTTGVKSFFGVDLLDAGMNENILNFRIGQIHDDLMSKKFSSYPRFEIKEYSKDDPLSIDITANFSKDKFHKLWVVFTFTKYLQRNKIVWFNFNQPSPFH
jgi:hypothetical protein